MSNSFTDFFETLLPREITLYVMPGSLTLVTILYVSQVKPNKLFNNYINLREVNSPRLEDYILYGIIWLFVAYLMGLIIGGIKQGVHRLVRDWEESNPLPNIKFKTRLRNENTHESTRELGREAMYIAIREEKMYRREIERYGVLVEAIENITVALIIVVVILLFTNHAMWGIALLPFVVFPVLAGAEGYKKLQYRRIETMFKALKEKERWEKEQLQITRQVIDKQQPSSEDSEKY